MVNHTGHKYMIQATANTIADNTLATAATAASLVKSTAEQTTTTLESMFLGSNRFTPMFFQVIGLRVIQFQIFNSIVKRVPVNMMNYFCRIKKSSQMFFHNKSVFLHIKVSFSVGMMWLKYRIIAICFKNSSSLKMMAFCIRALKRTVLSFQMSISSKLFSTFFTGSRYKRIVLSTNLITKFPYGIRESNNVLVTT